MTQCKTPSDMKQILITIKMTKLKWLGKRRAGWKIIFRDWNSGSNRDTERDLVRCSALQWPHPGLEQMKNCNKHGPKCFCHRWTKEQFKMGKKYIEFVKSDASVSKSYFGPNVYTGLPCIHWFGYFMVIYMKIWHIKLSEMFQHWATFNVEKEFV